MGPKSELGGMIALVLILAYLGWGLGLFVGVHSLIALFYYFYSDRNLSTKERLTNFAIYMFLGVVVIILYLALKTQLLQW